MGIGEVEFRQARLQIGMVSVYVLRSASSGRYYIGCAKDPNNRLNQHNAGTTKSTRGRGPWHLIYTEVHDSLAQARSRERQLKSWKSPRYLEQQLNLPIGGS